MGFSRMGELSARAEVDIYCENVSRTQFHVLLWKWPVDLWHKTL